MSEYTLDFAVRAAVECGIQTVEKFNARSEQVGFLPIVSPEAQKLLAGMVAIAQLGAVCAVANSVATGRPVSDELLNVDREKAVKLIAKEMAHPRV